MVKEQQQQSKTSLYSKQVILSVKSVQSVEKSLLPVTVTIRLGGGGLKSSCLEIELTLESDPLFLYVISVGEEEFHLLKTEQTLLVDFNSFPGKFIELLEACIANQGSDYPKYVAQLHQDATTMQQHPLWTFSIIETNSFKHINHLSLKFIPGNDFTTKNHLATVVKDLKANLAQTNALLHETSEALAISKSTLESGGKEMDGLKRANQEEKNSLVLNHAQELAREREKWTKALDDLRRETDAEEKLLRTKYEEQIKLLSAQFSSLQAMHSESQKAAQALESNLSSTQDKLSTLSVSASSYTQEKERLLTTKTHLEQSLLSAEKKIDTLQTKLTESEKLERQSVESKLKLEDKLENTLNQMKREEENSLLLKTQIERLEVDMKIAGDEILKANTIIRKLQSDLKSAKSKLKLKNVVTVQQEKLIEEKITSMESLQKEVASMKEIAAKHAEEKEANHQKISTLLTTIEENKKIIEDNNHVIDWLHKQLNEDALTRPKGGYSNIDFSKYSSASEAAKRPDSKYSNENSKPIEYARTRFTSIESAGAFERASPLPPSLPLGASRAPSTFSSHNAPARSKSPSSTAVYHPFNVNTSGNTSTARAMFGKSGMSAVPVPKPPKSNYF